MVDEEKGKMGQWPQRNPKTSAKDKVGANGWRKSWGRQYVEEKDEDCDKREIHK